MITDSNKVTGIRHSRQGSMTRYKLKAGPIFGQRFNPDIANI